jgi:hypothetical protein
MSDWYFREETAKSGQNLPPNQQKALSALLSNTSVEAAAQKCGLGERTVRRYLKDPTFAAAYREARDEIFTEAATGMRAIATKAITTLSSGLDESEDINTRLRAARSVLDYWIKTVELERRLKETEEFEERLKVLESFAASENGGGLPDRKWYG